VFGAIARLGSGEWSYVVTPIGFYAACVSFDYLFGHAAQQKLPYGSPVLQASSWTAALFAGLMLWRLGGMLFTAQPMASTSKLWLRLRHDAASRVWTPHSATTVIGIAFFFMLLLVGAWAYTDVLAELAQRALAKALTKQHAETAPIFRAAHRIRAMNPTKTTAIIGGGFAGTTLARVLDSRLPPDRELMLISEESYTTFNPMLPEAVG